MASTILPNVRNAQITGGQFNSIVDQRSFINSITVQRNGTSKGVDLLCEYCVLGALLDSNERFDPPRCSEDTRAALIEEILAWIYGGGDSTSMAWLFGGAGAGKSALAQTIAEICQKEGHLAAGFFFSRTSAAERSDGSHLIPTLVFQLIEAFPDLKVHVEECIDKHPGIFSRAPRTHMDLLFTKPLVSLKQQTRPPIPAISTTPLTPTPHSVLQTTSKPKSRRRGFVNKVLKKFTTNAEPESGPSDASLPLPQSHLAATATTIPGTTIEQANLNGLSRPRLIVIDGLDECAGQDIQIELLRILASAIPHIPFPLRFLIVSRPEGHITRTINYDKSFKGLDVKKIDLGDDENADSDIQRFLIRGFEEIRRTHPLRSLLGPLWPSEETIKNLVFKSSSHFIYAATAMKYIQYPRGRPDARLEVILGLSAPPTADKPFVELDALYTYIFMSMDEADCTTAKLAFGIVAFAGLDHFLPIRKSPVKLEEYLDMQAGEINVLLEPLLSLVVLPEDREDDIKILHASLLDFLLDNSRSGDLHIDLEMACDIISKYRMKEISAYTLEACLNILQGGDDKRTILYPIYGFLSHCNSNRISDDLRRYLVIFPALYDVVLHPKFILNHLTKTKSDTFFWISILLEIFLTIFDKKDFPNGQRWQTEQSMQIERRLQSIQGGHGPDPCLLNDTAQELLFNDISRQNVHRAYKALANLLLKMHGVEAFSEALISDAPQLYLGNMGEPLRLHMLIIFLPHLTHKDVENCTNYATWAGLVLCEESELHRVLQRRVEEYLQRIDGLVDPLELEKGKKAWGLVSTHPKISGSTE